MIARLGIIGVGEIASAIVTGLCATSSPPTVQLSPRNAGTARALAAAHPHVYVQPDNQAVVDDSDALLLTVPPASTQAVLSTLSVPGDRLLISAVAGWSRDRLSRCLPNRPEIVRVIPLPAVRQRSGVTAVFPRHAATEAMFSTLGEVVTSTSEELFSALSAATAAISSHLDYLAAISSWLVSQGWQARDAERFVRGVFSGVARGLTDTEQTLSDLVRAHETPDGINEALRTEWFTLDNRARLEGALQHILDRITLADEPVTSPVTLPAAVDFRVRAATTADRDSIADLLRAAWGGTTVVAHGTQYDASALPALIAERDGRPVGLLTYTVTGHGLEIVSLDALTRRTGVGTALLAAAVDLAREAGAARVWLVTTNDNLDALRFYQRRGLRIVAVAPGAVDAARRVKPAIPLVGEYGIALHDELTLELPIPQ